MAKLRAVPVVALCGMFLFLAATVVLLSTSVYRSVEAASADHAQERVALSYLMSQLRANDGAERIHMGSFGDGDALILSDGAYTTTLYCHEGHLMELYANEALDLPPESGYAIAQAESLSVEASGKLLRLTITQSTGEALYGEYLQASDQEVADG